MYIRYIQQLISLTYPNGNQVPICTTRGSPSNTGGMCTTVWKPLHWRRRQSKPAGNQTRHSAPSVCLLLFRGAVHLQQEKRFWKFYNYILFYRQLPQFTVLLFSMGLRCTAAPYRLCTVRESLKLCTKGIHSYGPFKWLLWQNYIFALMTHSAPT